MTIKESLQYFTNQSLFCRVVEICGFLGQKNGDYECRIVKNKHPRPSEQFSIDPVEYLRFMRDYDIVAIFHSHIKEDCSATDFDKVNSENTCVPFLIYSIPQKKFGLYEPANHNSNLTELKSSI